jgi:predicted Zn-dependent peptidase
MVLALALVLAASPPPPPTLSLKGTTTRLDNGLTVIISEDHTIPGVAIEVLYQVGSKDEEPGRTGFAHLYEHLMFMGARYVPYPNFDTIMEAAGGTNNAATSNDHTWYHETGPSNLLETFLWMEADRMATFGLEMNDEKLGTQKPVVLNERRQSYEARPYGMADLALWESLWPEGHPYHHPPIGSPRDIEAAQLDDVKRFFAKWYAPANAILTIVGDVDTAQAQALARQYFGWIPSPPRPEHPAIPPLPEHKEEMKRQLTDKVELPELILAWATPPYTQPGDAECDILATVLAHGKASRLYRRLVHEKQVATQVGASQESHTLGSVFTVEVLARPGKELAEVQKEADAVIRELLAKGPTQAELDAARNVILGSDARALEGLASRAHLLATMQAAYGDASALEKDLARYSALTPKSVAEAGRKLLGPGRVVVEVRPEPGEDSAGKGGASR